MIHEKTPGESQTIAALFDEWKKSSCCIDEKILKNSFCKDGVTSKAGHACNNNTDPHVDVLFVLKESNLWDKNTKQFCPNTDDTFWFDECIDDKTGTRKQYCDCFEIALGYIKYINQKDNNVDIERFGYMNINKRGGKSKTDMKKLSEYASCHAEYIRRQIKLHSPRYIVFCGCFDKIANVLYKGVGSWKGIPQTIRLNEKEDKETTLLYMYHPSWTCAPKKCGPDKSPFERLKEAINDQLTKTLNLKSNLRILVEEK